MIKTLLKLQYKNVFIIYGIYVTNAFENCISLEQRKIITTKMLMNEHNDNE